MNLRGIRDFVERNDSFLLTAHETPDADALGSEVALHGLLAQLGKDVRIVNADSAPHIFEFISGSIELEVLSDESRVPEDVDSRALIILDVNDIRNIGNVADLILPRCVEYFILDHHEREGTIVTENCIEEEASSTSELIYELVVEMNGEINEEMANAMYAGIVFDTGSFIYPKTSARTFDIARHLVELGVVPNRVYTLMYESNSIEALLLQTKVAATLNLYLDKHVAVQRMTAETLVETGATYGEGQTLINMPLRSEKVRVSVFFKESPEGIVRCSLRSKGAIDVAEIAQSMGGGGHKTAAGFKCSDNIDESLQRVLAKLRPYFD